MSSAIPQAGSGAPEAAEQVVVAAAPAEREADRRVVDLEHRARVVAELAHEAEVEYHPVRDAALGKQLVQLAQPLHGAPPAFQHLGARRAARGSA